ncbi:MAG: hypothetical protein AAGN15_09265 [Cyanobacteria bacterium J06581_3]
MNNNFSNPDQNTRPVGMALKLLTAASLFLLPACSTAQTKTTAAEEANVTAEQVVESTADYVGQEVTIRSEVEETLDGSSFLVADDEYFDGEGILVVNASGEAFVVPEVGDPQVQVTGKVETFVAQTVASEYGLSLTPELYEEYQNKPVIIAQSIALAPDPGDITADPELYYNKRIAVEGEVEDILESGLFTMDEDELFGGDDLLVIPSETATVEDGEIVTVTGILRPYIKAEFEKDYDLQWDLSIEESIEAEYEQKPVFVADTVYPSGL